MIKVILSSIEKEFESALSKKTGWGKNEIFSIYKDIQIKVLSEALTKIEEKNKE